MKLRRLAAWLAAYVMVSVVFMAPLSFHAGERLPDDGDSLQGLWITWWGATHWERGFPSILEANGYYPHTKSLLFSEPQLGQALLATPLFAIADNHVLVYNLLVIVSLALSALTCHLFVRELAGSDRAGVLGAIVYTFNAHTLSHLARVQLVTLQWMPLGLFCLHRFFSRRDARYLVPFVAVSILQGLSSFYYLLFYVVMLAILVPFYLAENFRPRGLAALAAAAIACGALILPLTLPYIDRFALYGFTAAAESMEVLDFFRPHADSPLYAALGLAGEPRLIIQFLGFGTLALTALGLVTALRGQGALSPRLASGYAVVAMAAFSFALGPDAGPYRLLDAMGFGIRDPGRFAVVLRLALAVLVGIAATSISNRRGVAALALFLFVEQLAPSRVAGVAIPSRTSFPWVDGIPREASGAVVNLPVRSFGQIRLNTFDAYFSTYHGRPFVFGKPSIYPPAHELLRHALVDFPAPPTLELLAALEIETLVVHPEQWTADERPAKLEALVRAEQAGDLALVARFEPSDEPAAARYGLGSEQLYRVTARADAGEPNDCACREIDRASFEVSASGESTPELAIDSDPSTAWTTGLFLRRGDYFEIDFGTTRRPARIEMALRYPFIDLPRGLEVNGFRGPRFFRFEQRPDLATTVSLIRDLADDPRGARLRFDLVPMDVDRIRIFVNRLAHDVPGWSLPEIYVYEEAPGR